MHRTTMKWLCGNWTLRWRFFFALAFTFSLQFIFITMKTIGRIRNFVQLKNPVFQRKKCSGPLARKKITNKYCAMNFDCNDKSTFLILILEQANYFQTLFYFAIVGRSLCSLNRNDFLFIDRKNKLLQNNTRIWIFLVVLGVIFISATKF